MKRLLCILVIGILAIYTTACANGHPTVGVGVNVQIPL